MEFFERVVPCNKELHVSVTGEPGEFFLSNVQPVELGFFVNFFLGVSCQLFKVPI